MRRGWSLIEVKLDVNVSHEHLGSVRVLSASSTVAVILGEPDDSARNITETFSKLSVGRNSIINFSYVLFAKVCICLKEDLSNVVSSSSNLEDVGLEVRNQSLRSAIVRSVKAEAGNFETDLIEAAVLLNIETNLVEFTDGLEDLKEVSTSKIFVKLNHVSIGSLTEALLISAFRFVLVESFAITV